MVPRPRIRFARFTVASAIATTITQLVFVTGYSFGPNDALTVSTVAFAAGTVPHFLMVRYWAWAEHDPSRLGRQLTGYLVVTVAGGAASIGLATLAEPLVATLDPDWQAVLLSAAYLAASGPVFLAKFFVFDRIFATPPAEPVRKAVAA
jgi:putative flippase GtrA